MSYSAMTNNIKCSKTKHVQGFGSLLGYLPFLLTILIGGGIIICYCVAISLKHVEPAFPYISDTGTFPPESCIFTLCLNCAAVVALAIFTLKYLHIIQYNRDASRRVRIVNKAALITGYVSAFGIMIVGAFQETNVLAVHVIGAMMAFVGGTVYMFLIASLGFMRDVNFAVDERKYAKARMIMAVVSLISFIITMGLSAYSMALWEPFDPSSTVQTWSRKDKGYDVHLVATAFEWVMALDLLTFLMTFSAELHIIQLQCVLVRQNGNTYPSPTISDYSNTNRNLLQHEYQP